MQAIHEQQHPQLSPSAPHPQPPATSFTFKMRPPMDVKFDNISYHITPRKRRPLLPPKKLPPVQILHSISGHVPAGESLAILGPSGCGKTSLLNILAARSAEPPSSGTVTFSGQPRHPRTKRDIGYVMQDDVFLSQLTVRETLEFTAEVRLPSSLTPQERAARVDHVIARLRLTKCQHTRVGTQSFDKGISGGERKRLNIANELLHEPSLLLADECTSGLDSSSAYTVIKFLSELCDEGRTVVVTIHQPSSQMFSLFDNIMLLAAGRIAYFGPSAHMVEYFERIGFPFPSSQYNPADYALELVIDKSDDNAGSGLSEIDEPTRILDAWDEQGDAVLCELAVTHPLPARRPRPEHHLPLQHRQQAKDKLLPFASRRNLTDTDMSASTSRGTHIHVSMDDMKPPNLDEQGRISSLDDTESSSAELAEVVVNPIEQHSLNNQQLSEQGTTVMPPVVTHTLGRMQRATTKRLNDIAGRRGHDGVADKYPTNWWKQVSALSKRAFRKKQGIMTELSQLIQLAAIIISLSILWAGMRVDESTIEDRLGSLSFVPIFWMVFSALNALRSFPPEREVLNKDRASGSYRLSAYFVSKMMVELPVDMLFPISASGIMYYIINYNPDVRAFFLYIVVITLNNLVAHSMGLLVSAVVMDIPMAQVFTAVWMQVNMLSSGYIVNPDNLPTIFRIQRQVNFLKIAYEGLVQIEMSFGRTIACNKPPLAHTEYSFNGRNCPIDKETFLRAAQIEGAPPIWLGIVYQVLFIVVFRVLAYLALKLLHREHKPKLSFWRMLAVQ